MDPDEKDEGFQGMYLHCHMVSYNGTKSSPPTDSFIDNMNSEQLSHHQISRPLHEE